MSSMSSDDSGSHNEHQHDRVNPFTDQEHTTVRVALWAAAAFLVVLLCGVWLFVGIGMSSASNCSTTDPCSPSPEFLVLLGLTLLAAGYGASVGLALRRSQPWWVGLTVVTTLATVGVIFWLNEFGSG